MKQSGLALLAALLLSTTAHAQIANDKVKIGVMSDLSGIYESGAGNGSVEAVRIRFINLRPRHKFRVTT